MWGSGCLCCGGQGGRPQAPGLRGCGRPPGEGAHGSAPPPATPTGRVLANREAALECSPVLGVGPRRGGAQGLASPAAPASAGHVCVCVHTCVSVSALTQLRLGGASLGSGSEGDAAQPPPRGSPVVSHSVGGGGVRAELLSVAWAEPACGGRCGLCQQGPALLEGPLSSGRVVAAGRAEGRVSWHSVPAATVIPFVLGKPGHGCAG